MNFYVGTSGYSYKEWKGKFYPREIKPAEMLAFYAEHFRSVEINSTFYKLPELSVVNSWALEVPAAFPFALKAPNSITHLRRLNNVAEPLASFLELATGLRKQLGPLLFQLPPNFKKDAGRFDRFLSLLPKQFRCAVEFRHESWFDDEIIELLRQHKAALCIAETDDGPKPRFEATTNWGYLRLRRTDYSIQRLKTWAAFIQRQKWTDTFVYFMHEDRANGPRYAKQLLKILEVE